MYRLKAFLSLFLILIASFAHAQDTPTTIIRETSDATTLAADLYPADAETAPAILLLHMLNSRRSAYEPLIPDLHAAGYTILNIDMRGHGDSGGAQDWDAIIADTSDWIAWLADNDHLNDSGLAIIGASIGANVALIACADADACRGAVALSPGLDYRGVKPESALVDGLADRTALLVASGADASSSTAIRQMFLNAQGDVSARLYRGRAHGTRLFDSAYASVSRLILNWLDETFASDDG